ncbi:hypothetical protein AM228_16945 [Planktothricoides sp. SR001]|uniref:hypothetical protein n=1 Tax=Planktothricoides sp. SR001 TaxID=1705388 RepID=UPI0006C26754|nr:hypothetical protein [Planktothricoides sp. SR001]KOR35730.1 hypothetical protein AM228_16945 [Planktothricoides sp. SR001]
MLKINKSYVFDQNKQAIAVQIPIAEFERIEQLISKFGLDQILESDAEDAWLNQDLSRLSEYDAYEWQAGELGSGKPVNYVEGVGLVIGEE